MQVQLLNKESVLEYAVSRGLFSSSSEITVEILTGGVSNVVLAMSGEGRDLVLKQALPELNVPGIWRADQRRAIVEADALKIFQGITPRNVPQLIDSDPERFTLVLERAPRNVTNWKEDLLAGKIQPEVAGEIGRILGLWHQKTFQRDEILQHFNEDELFDQLRISPFYRAIAHANPEIGSRIANLIAELEGDKSSLVHGDYSPKNILVEENGTPIILDFEVAHAGNPVFDLAFFLGHLLAKFVYSQSHTAQGKVSRSAMLFLSQYQQAFTSPSPTLSWHVAAIALARVDGVSRVSYLSEDGRLNLRNTCLGLLQSDTPASMAEVFSEL